MADLDDLARRYVELWNEPDDERRRAGIAELWAPDAEHYAPGREAKGHDALFTRITGAFASWVADGKHLFRARTGANGHHDAVRFNWEMVRTADDATISVGFDLVVLDKAGLIKTDFQFVDA